MWDQFLSKGDQACFVSLQSALFFLEQFLLPQDVNCCGRVANGTGCCRSGRENTMLSWMLKPITSIFNIALELWCVSNLSGSAVVQIYRALWAVFSVCLLENAASVCVLFSMNGHHDMGFKTVMFLLSLQGATLLWNSTVTTASSVLPASGALKWCIFLWKRIWIPRYDLSQTLLSNDERSNFLSVPRLYIWNLLEYLEGKRLITLYVSV